MLKISPDLIETSFFSVLKKWKKGEWSPMTMRETPPALDLKVKVDSPGKCKLSVTRESQ